MPDRFRRFDIVELTTLQNALNDEWIALHRIGKDTDVVHRLETEIEHEITQQRHRAHRELLPS